MKSSELKLYDVLVRFTNGGKQQFVVNGISNDTVYFENHPKPYRIFCQSKERFEKSRWTKLGNIKPKG